MTAPPNGSAAWRLQGRVALVTGSSSGIGAVTASALAASGADVVVNSSLSRDAGERVAAEIGGCYVQADISDPAAARALVESVHSRFGRLDLVVNAAGRTHRIPHGDLESVTPEVWSEILGTNLLGTWEVVRAAAPALREAPGGGCIINITSTSGLRGGGSSIPYAVSKAALNHLTRLLAAALGPKIRVNAVAPGLIETPWTSDWDDARDNVVSRAPLRRVGQPEDVARAVVGLVGSTYTTGEVVTVDGGYHALP